MLLRNLGGLGQNHGAEIGLRLGLRRLSRGISGVWRGDLGLGGFGSLICVVDKER